MPEAANTRHGWAGVMGEIVAMRGSRLSVAANRQSRQMLAANIAALLRRRVVTPLQGRAVAVEFETEAEAAALQKLIHALPRARR